MASHGMGAPAGGRGEHADARVGLVAAVLVDVVAGGEVVGVTAGVAGGVAAWTPDGRGRGGDVVRGDVGRDGAGDVGGAAADGVRAAVGAGDAGGSVLAGTVAAAVIDEGATVGADV